MPRQVAGAVAVGVEEAADEHLVEDRALVPVRVGLVGPSVDGRQLACPGTARSGTAKPQDVGHAGPGLEPHVRIGPVPGERLPGQLVDAPA